MKKAIMIQGTCSNAGKSLVVAGLCRIFKQDGYKVAPFKAQNMALNSYITEEGFEMGRAQVMQAEASCIEPDVRMNPLLLKPTSDKGSQIILSGKVFGNMTAEQFYAKKSGFKDAIKKAYDSLAKEYDIIVIEGAGSPAEINLQENDLVNMGMAEMAGAPVLLVGDIDRGGVFASLAGTLLLLSDDDKKRIKGVMINKFRGDIEILKPGLRMLEDVINVPVTGVIPFINVDIDDEDSLSERLSSKSKESLIDIVVVNLPRISNFTDFNALDYIDGVGVRYVASVAEMGSPDMIIIPGTKNTMGDLKWMRESGIESEIKKFASKGNPVFGICGGYQMLGQSISDPYSVESGGHMDAMKLLPHSTVFDKEKTTCKVDGELSPVTGIFEGLSGLKYSGYEIHMGKSEVEANIINRDNIYGSYIHGIFDSSDIAKEIVACIMKTKGIVESDIKSFDMNEYKQSQYDILADAMRQSIDMNYIYEIMKGE